MIYPEIPDENSEDLTDEEIAQAIPSGSSEDVLQHLRALVRERAGMSLDRHELRRRKPHLYWRTILNHPEGPHRVLFLADWLQGGPSGGGS